MGHHRRAGDGQTLTAGLVALRFKGIRTSIAKDTYIFVVFQGVRTHSPPSGPAHAVRAHSHQDVNVYKWMLSSTPIEVEVEHCVKVL